MPTRLYRPIREHLTTLDHVMAHEAKFSLVAGIWTTIGLVLCWTWIDPGGGPHTILSDLPPWAAGGVSVALLVSGLLVLTAVAWPGKDSTAWRIELFALPLGIAAWVSYGVVTPSPFWQIIATGYVIGSLVRFVAAWLNMRRPVRVVVIVEE